MKTQLKGVTQLSARTLELLPNDFG